MTTRKKIEETVENTDEETVIRLCRNKKELFDSTVNKQILVIPNF